jgi:hypothetical protein
MSYYYKDYHWRVRKSTNGIRYDPPSDPSFYDTASHDRASDYDLTDTAQLIEVVLEEWREWDVMDAEDHLLDLIEERKPRHDQLKHLVQHIKAILRQRMENNLEDEALVDGDSDDNNPQPQPFPLPHPHHMLINTVITTPPPDIIVPKPFPPSPNISPQQSQLYSHSPRHQHPPDNLAPLPIPIKPNIPVYQQPRRPPHTRPRRKHPPTHVCYTCSRTNIS